MKLRSRNHKVKKLHLACNLEELAYTYMRPFLLMIYKHIPLEREMRWLATKFHEEWEEEWRNWSYFHGGMEVRVRICEVMWREKRENGEKRDEDEVESEGMSKMKWEMSLLGGGGRFWWGSWVFGRIGLRENEVWGEVRWGEGYFVKGRVFLEV